MTTTTGWTNARGHCAVLTSSRAVRSAFWATHPELRTETDKPKVRLCFSVWVDHLHRARIISDRIAHNATLEAR